MEPAKFHQYTTLLQVEQDKRKLQASLDMTLEHWEEVSCTPSLCLWSESVLTSV